MKSIALCILLAASVVLSACQSNHYWYCWDQSRPGGDPHHLGHRVTGDHLCSDQELSDLGYGSK